MPNLNISQKSIDDFTTAMNHRMTSIEEKTGILQIDVKWMKRIGYYMASVLTIIAVKSIFF